MVLLISIKKVIGSNSCLWDVFCVFGRFVLSFSYIGSIVLDFLFLFRWRGIGVEGPNSWCVGLGVTRAVNRIEVFGSAISDLEECGDEFVRGGEGHWGWLALQWHRQARHIQASLQWNSLAPLCCSCPMLHCGSIIDIHNNQNSSLWCIVIVATCPSRASEGEAHGCAFQRRKDARSRHQCLFVENVKKTEGNRSKWKF